jgi:hypothetical protein
MARKRLGPIILKVTIHTAKIRGKIGEKVEVPTLPLRVRKYERKYSGEPNYHGAEPENHKDELPQQSLHGVKGNELRIAFDEINYQWSDAPADKLKT